MAFHVGICCAVFLLIAVTWWRSFCPEVLFRAARRGDPRDPATPVGDGGQPAPGCRPVEQYVTIAGCPRWTHQSASYAV